MTAEPTAVDAVAAAPGAVASGAVASGAVPSEAVARAWAEPPTAGPAVPHGSASPHAVGGREPVAEQHFPAGTDESALLLSRPRPTCGYLYRLDELAARVGRIVDALPDRCRMFAAIKANSANPILRTLAPLVAGFEVASGGELRAVREVAPAAPLLFGGPAKTEPEIAAALAAGVTRFHVESPLELYRISAAATRIGAIASILLRVNPAGPFPAATLTMAGVPTQFGIDERALPLAVQLATALPGLRFAGFHLHSVSNNLSAAAHLDLLEHYRRTILGWEREFGVTCTVVNVGGGIGVDYTDPANRFDWPGFCAGLRAVVRRCPGHWREIDFECGRFLLADCGRYAAEVLDIKRNHGSAFVLLRGGTHHFRLPASWQHSHPFTVLTRPEWPHPYPRPEVRDEPITVAGELCTPKDVLARNVPVHRLRVGDLLVFEQAGAYGWEISHDRFLRHPAPEQLFIGEPASNGADDAAPERPSPN